MSALEKILKIRDSVAWIIRGLKYEFARFVYADDPKTMPEEMVYGRIFAFIIVVFGMAWADGKLALELNPFLYLFVVGGFCFSRKVQNYLWALRKEMNPPPADDPR